MGTLSKPETPHALPLNSKQPNDIHAVSSSLPTWRSVVGAANYEDWIMDTLEVDYPRFVVHALIQRLLADVKSRLGISDSLDGMAFPSEQTAKRFVFHLSANKVDRELKPIRFYLPDEKNDQSWSSFYAVFFPKNLGEDALHLWTILGEGLTSRHAEFLQGRIDYMASECEDTSFCTSAPVKAGILSVPWKNSAQLEKQQIRDRISHFATSERLGSIPVPSSDVFLYEKGMSAIAAIARCMSTSVDDIPSNAVIYGWTYTETPGAARLSGFQQCTHFALGTAKELDELELFLASGQQVKVLFTELPCNPTVESPDLARIRALADQYNFIVVCDDTLASFANVDLFPYVDVLVTSLTKIFSGAANVMGGSVVINPQSPHHDFIHSALTTNYEDNLFPLDAIVLAHNSIDYVQRTHRCNKTAFTLATALSAHKSIRKVHYPPFVQTAPLYEKVRRRNGGYGFILSLFFHSLESAVCFYNALDVRKGASCGTNFTLAIAYTELTHNKDFAWAAESGVTRDCVRISVGLEDEDVLLDRMERALDEVHKVEGSA
ncbi:hypothetical protein ASPWEDRAFT_33427 [Aspergillus wentii DTO 134E9]|uniref:Cystathionine gamma-synthase n=1 Tax=Aspergillus wentii DTO 134E9 TaxID=1073089 RepID=A0A1L9RYW7_ASPWE|nr:uncharacterized protein ASPWEDRAFT_33427 [Aspergillus wentii DTO 134E9]KAI9932527.1 hypothetical protein MW887_008769 [Aspergillus wentii]OJJ40093.1 hypothetical protein ASPWEDRAFT_33427 [Aspergillus wentii DTO 134E9]